MGPVETAAKAKSDRREDRRDRFACAALTALGGHKAVTARGIPWLVEHAYMVADAMLEKSGTSLPEPAPTVATVNAPRADVPHLVNAGQLRSLFGITYSRPTLWRMGRAGTFPKPVQLSPHRVAWRSADVVAWIESKAKR